jgi:hypothetical protein
MNMRFDRSTGSGATSRHIISGSYSEASRSLDQTSSFTHLRQEKNKRSDRQELQLAAATETAGIGHLI